MKKYNITISLILILIFLSTIDVNFVFYSKNAISTDNYNTLKKASFWELSQTIHITYDNWSSKVFPWIQVHNGTWDDPHIIENVTIDKLGIGNGILIENSHEFFIIRNCTIFNGGINTGSSQYNLAGIKLINTSNGTLVDNECYNNQEGIYLYTCSNITLEQNICRNNDVNGIYLYTSSVENHLNRNIVYSNLNHGIVLFTLCSDNDIIGNEVYDNRNGILLLSNCDQNLISSNKLYLNNWEAVNLDTGCDNNEILHNNVTQNQEGILLNIGSNNNFLFNNTLMENEGSGLIIFNSDSNTVWKNIITSNAGEYIPSSNPSAYSGVYFHSSILNNFSGNIISDSYYGIYLELSDNNTVQYNTIRRFTICIEEIDCIGNIILNNNCYQPTSPAIYGYSISILLALCILMTFLIIKFKTESAKKQ
ncbi:MAG: nitrous oxide reductase family maturation protein NosD [Candidatus Odinarchaeota archaeon]